ncbi:MAG: hypothetical protein ACSLFL_03130 [Alphaproteobacteria bacterium]
MSIQGIIAIIAGLLVFLGLMSMVGQVHVGEFFGSMAIATIIAIIIFFKTPKSWRVTSETTLRHKTQKQSFRLEYWVTVVLNCAALAWLLSPTGMRIVKSVVGVA